MVARYRLLPSTDDQVTADSARSLLTTIAGHNLPIVTFQLIGNGTTSEIYLALTINADFGPTLEKLVVNFYPHAELEPEPAPLETKPTITAAYSSGNSFLREFSNFDRDPLMLFVNTLTELQPSEEASFSVDFMFWNHRQDPSTAPFYGCSLEGRKQDVWLAGAWAVGVNLSVFSLNPERAKELFNALDKCLGQFTGPYGGKLSTPPHSWKPRYYTPKDWSLPPCMREKSLLTLEELAGLVHLPHKSVTAIQRANAMQQKAPDELTTPEGLLLGTNEWRRQTKEVRLPHQLRSRHTYIVGASGSGKSNLLKNCILQDIEAGRGLCVIDPHGDLVTDVLPFIPSHRFPDVVIFNPSDRDWPVSLNPFIPTTDDNRNDVALTFKTAFIRLFNVGDEARRMLNLLHFTTLALLEAGEKTFLDIRKFLINPEFQSKVLESINDPTVLEFWYEEFPRTYPKAATAPISTRLAQFALSPVTRNILGQPKQTIDLYNIMNSGKILLCPLGKIQEEERQLLGSLLVSQLQLATMRRAEMPEGLRRPFTLYIDEFQNFASDAESLEKILSEARKYNLALVLAHQFTSQLPTKLADAIIANAYSKIIFRVGVDDARYLEKAVMGYEAKDLQNLSIGQAICCAGRAQDSFSLKTYRFPDPPANHQAEALIEQSRKTYGRPRAEVERQLRPQRPADPPPAATPAGSDEQSPGPPPGQSRSAFDDLP